MKKTRFYQIIIALLIVINIVAISFIFFRKPPKPGSIKLTNQIGLTGDNAGLVSTLETEHHKDKRALLVIRGDSYMALYENIEDSTKSTKLLESISDLNTKIDKMTFEFFKEVSSLCNEDQKTKLKDVIHHSFKRTWKKGQKH